jgi:putative lipoic acid-binding regulatory protein
MKKKDPIDSSTDTENTSGNILNALLKFPVQYIFHVVGKTSGDVTIQSLFVEQVKEIIVQTSPIPPIFIIRDKNDNNTATTFNNTETRDSNVLLEVTERGTKYTKVSIEKEVINAEEIAHIYNLLGQLELSVMQF